MSASPQFTVLPAGEWRLSLPRWSQTHPLGQSVGRTSKGLSDLMVWGLAGGSHAPEVEIKEA